MEEIRVIYLDVYNRCAPEVKMISEDIDTFYKMLVCDSIEVPVRSIGGKLYRIICDGEFALKDEFGMFPSAITSDGRLDLCGNLIICGHAVVGDGNLSGLTEEDCQNIFSHVALAINDDETMHLVFSIDNY